MLVKAKLPTILLLQFQSCLSKILESCLICLTPSLCAVIHSFMLCNFRSVQCSLYTIVWWPYHRTALIVQVGWKMGPEHPRANCLGGWGAIGPAELVIVILCCRIHSYWDFKRLWHGKEMCYTGIQVKWVGIVHCATSFSQLSAFFSCYVGRRQDNWIRCSWTCSCFFVVARS